MSVNTASVSPTPSTNLPPALMTTPVASVQLLQLDQLLCLRIQHPKGSALLALQGAQLLEYTPAGDRPLVWLSETAAFLSGQSVRGGIPVCWPWFGDLARNPESVRQMAARDKAPAHGLVRSEDWVLVHASEDDAAVTLRLRCPQVTSLGLLDATGAAAQLQLELELRIGATLEVQLTTHNLGSQPCTISQALHTYFSVSHVDQIQIRGYDQTQYLDTLDGWQTKCQEGAIRIDQEVDRIYLNAPTDVCIEDSGWQRRIHLSACNSASAVVWNPWIEKAQRLSQFAEDAYQRMLCIETANVLEDALSLAGGQSHSLGFRLHSEAL